MMSGTITDLTLLLTCLITLATALPAEELLRSDTAHGPANDDGYAISHDGSPLQARYPCDHCGHPLYQADYDTYNQQCFDACWNGPNFVDFPAGDAIDELVLSVFHNISAQHPEWNFRKDLYACQTPAFWAQSDDAQSGDTLRCYITTGHTWGDQTDIKYAMTAVVDANGKQVYDWYLERDPYFPLPSYER